MRILEVKGSDSGDFLHRITSGPVKPLGVGQGAGGLLLTGQSRMLASFDLIRREAATYWLVTPPECFETLLHGLEKLHFAEDLSLAPLPLFAGVRPAPLPERPTIFAQGEGGQTWPAAVPGYETFIDAHDPPLPEGWEFDRIGAGLPSPADWDHNTPALEAAALPFIDRHKGCYPGQEVVERSLNVGHPARLLVAIEADRSFHPGEKLTLAGGGEGMVTTAASRDGVGRAMVRVPWAKREMPEFRLLKK